MYIRGDHVNCVELKSLIETLQNFVECSFLIKSTNISKKTVVKFWPQFPIQKYLVDERVCRPCSCRITWQPLLQKQNSFISS